MNEKGFPELGAIRKQLEMLGKMSCAELATHLSKHWETLEDCDRAYISFLMADKGCQEAVPYLLYQLESESAENRNRALPALESLRRREYRTRFIELHLGDPSIKVRESALIYLSTLFRNERDTEILCLALAAWDSPASSVRMRLDAGAAMMYQLDIPHDERGAPAWWDEENEYELEHPSIVRAVKETRQLLAKRAFDPKDTG